MGTYKTNWKLTETVMPEDFNRIEENIKENNKNHNDFKTEYDKTLKEQNKKIDSKPEKSDVVLKIPQRLPATTDLNTVVKGGNYIVVENTPNSPVSYGRLVVYQWDASAKWITQVLYSDMRNEVYTRCSTNSEATSWTPWKKLISTSETDNKYLNKNLGNVSDFNLCKTEGIYNVQAENIPNAPFKSSTKIYGKLIVYVRDRDITHIFISHENRIFLRFCNNGELWGNWTKVFSTFDTPSWDDVKGKPEIYTKAESDTRYLLSDLGTAIDFNNCKTNPGTWLVNSGSSVPNAPYEGGIWGTLEVLNSTVKGDFIQRFTNVAGEVFSRYYHSSTKTWDSWTDNNKKFMRTNVSEVEDFNTCLNAGVYLVGSYTTLPNAPYNDSTGIYGTLEVFDRRTEYIQRFTDSSSRVFIRFKNYKGKWTSWVYQTNINDFEGENGKSHGYQVLPSGIIIQWGSTVIPFDGHRAHGYLYYPIAFKEYVHCCGNVASNDYGGFCETSGTVAGDSLTRGYAEALDIGNGNKQGHNVRFQWIAIGK